MFLSAKVVGISKSRNAIVVVSVLICIFISINSTFVILSYGSSRSAGPRLQSKDVVIY